MKKAEKKPTAARYAREETICNKSVELREQIKALYPDLSCTVRKNYGKLGKHTDPSRAYHVSVYGNSNYSYQGDDGECGSRCFVAESFYIGLNQLKSLSLDDIKNKVDLAKMSDENKTAPIEREKAMQKREQEYRKHEAKKLANLKAERAKRGFKAKVHVIDHPVGNDINTNYSTRTRLFVKGSTGHSEVTGYFIGHVPKGSFAVRETGGTKVEGPWAYSFSGNICISADGRGTHWEVEQARAKGLIVEACVGDLIEIEGTRYSIEWDDTFGIPRTGYIKLIVDDRS